MCANLIVAFVRLNGKARNLISQMADTPRKFFSHCLKRYSEQSSHGKQGTNDIILMYITQGLNCQYIHPMACFKIKLKRTENQTQKI